MDLFQLAFITLGLMLIKEEVAGCGLKPRQFQKDYAKNYLVPICFVRIMLNICFGRTLTNGINFLVLICTAWVETFYFYTGIINIWDAPCFELGYFNFWVLYILLHCLPSALAITFVSTLFVLCCPVLTLYLYRVRKERNAN